MGKNLTDTDRADLARFLREAIEADRYPFTEGAAVKGAAGEDRSCPRAGCDAVPRAAGALNTQDQKLLALMVKQVGVAPRPQHNNGIVRSANGPGQFMLWEVER
jgi:hypothetical protein